MPPSPKSSKCPRASARTSSRVRSRCRPTSTSPSPWKKSATTIRSWVRPTRIRTCWMCCWSRPAPRTSSSARRPCRPPDLTAHIVDVEAFALENACALMRHQMPDGGMDRTVAVVDFGASSTTFSVLRDMKVIYTRDFAFGGQQLTEEIMRTYGLSMEEAGPRQERGRPAEQLPARSARSLHRRHDPAGQPLAAVLSGLRQRPLAARSDPDLRRLRQHPGRRRGHLEPRRRARRQGRPARQHESVLEGEGAGRRAGTPPRY